MRHDDLARAVEILRAGGVVAFPTETVYGLGADALSANAVQRVYELKGRPAHNPLIVHVTGRDMAARVCSGWNDDAESLARAFWPGPLSIVVPRGPGLPDGVTGGGTTVAVRSPDHPMALALLFEFGGPLVGPSANLSGRVSPTTAEHVRQSFSEEDVFVLDGGACPTGIESTVVLIDGQTIRVLRPGVIGAAQIAKVLRKLVEPAGSAAAVRTADRAPLPSPGMLDTHYAPACDAVLFEPHDYERLLASSRDVIVILTHEPRSVPPPHRVLQMPADANRYAKELYATLRAADETKPSLIAVERPPPADPINPDAEIWEAVLDRLARATRPFR
ncbi:MAG: threonylcarbamoyl-AMP synthase [Phycisphaeraceae bacterium]|nr:threonylcarbamoyl-AMP synthase [Phycisphaeraceae bacterium]